MKIYIFTISMNISNGIVQIFYTEVYTGGIS